MDEYSAIAAMGGGLDGLLKWERGEYPRWFMAAVVAWYKLKQHIEGHSEEARAKDAEKRAKRKARRGR